MVRDSLVGTTECMRTDSIKTCVLHSDICPRRAKCKATCCVILCFGVSAAQCRITNPLNIPVLSSFIFAAT